jgi:hypothetical protein
VERAARHNGARSKYAEIFEAQLQSLELSPDATLVKIIILTEDDRAFVMRSKREDHNLR